MATMRYGSVERGYDPGKTGLNAFQRAGVDMLYSCRTATYLSSMTRVTDGAVNGNSQRASVQHWRIKNNLVPVSAFPAAR